MSDIDLDRFIAMQRKVRTDHEQLEKRLRHELKVLKVYSRIIEQLLATAGRDPAFQRTCKQIAGDILTPPTVLSWLAELEDADIQRLVAENPNAPQKTLQWFCDDSARKTAWLRAAVAGNPRAPDSLLNKLRKDKESPVALVASEMLKKRKLL